ncbi:host cell division inhibitor Icd-like protein [Salmonella enterica subsp. enterica serovar Corvallis]|nr:host cell division inhibitor Icd-like protein [Salmonella enterica subsp. enterica serovar Corvallis]
MPHDVVQVPGSSLAFLRWRRLISPLTAVTIKCAFVSPSSRLLSNSATTSCGKRALSCCDLLLVEPVAITGSPCVRCDSVYAKKIIIKDLKCDSLEGRFKSKGAIHLVYAKPDSAGTLNGLLTNPLYEETKMAKQKCTWLFAAINRSQRNAHPVMLRITADNERSARRRLAPDYVLSFAGRIPCGGEHA